MIGVASALLAVAIGCALVYRFGGLTEFPTRWAVALLVFGAGCAAGIGLTSCLFFVCRLAAPAMPRLSLMVEAALSAWLVFEIVRRRPANNPTAAESAVLVPWLMCGLIAALLIVTAAMAAAWEANPQGNWDAWSIWNLRARFLAAGDQPQRAWSPALSGSHPEYPLLVSAFVARCWSFAGSMPEAAPIAVSYLFFLALVSIVTGGFAVYRGKSLGLLLGLCVATTPVLLHEVVAQYADVPLACYMAASILFALIDRPLLAGFFAGLAASTKDEGVLFLAIFFLALTIARRPQLSRAALAAIPGVAMAAVFKIAFAPSTSVFLQQGPGAVFPRIADAGRIGQTLTAVLHEFGAMGAGWYHPILPVLALAAGLGLELKPRKDLLFAAAIPAAMAAGYFLVLLSTPSELKWQLDTSLYRLVVQLWPGILIAVFCAIKSPAGE